MQERGLDIDDGTVQGFARRIVEDGRLEEKLRAPPADLVDPVEHRPPAAASLPTRPAREASIAFSERSDRLPKLHALTEPGARVACLSRFAHHELMAVELFAWALLAFPELPSALRLGMITALADEQAHCRLYLARLEAHGARFGDLPLSDYFWRHVPAIASAPNPPLAFLCAQGLTLEQANLDFTLLYRDAFRAAGDEETATVLQRVHDDEIAHVALAAVWTRKLSGQDDADAYAAHVPFPFAAARAKGRRFDVAARRKARLSEPFIEGVRSAQPYRPRPAT
jgi:uncharacterized ferritin-like protein (DUF455 family)